MNVQELEMVLVKEELNRLARRRTQNLAAALASIAGIADGRHIVSLIGKGDERSNLEALNTWVAFELKHCKLADENQLDYLYARLLMVLGDYAQ
jgi:hypothetical protein